MTEEAFEDLNRILRSLAMDPALTQKCLDVLADYQRKRITEQKEKAA